jgi:hypothetical protein
MMQEATYVGWDFVNVWDISEGSTYPYMQWEPTPISNCQELQNIKTMKGLVHETRTFFKHPSRHPSFCLTSIWLLTTV